MENVKNRSFQSRNNFAKISKAESDNFLARHCVHHFLRLSIKHIFARSRILQGGALVLDSRARFPLTLGQHLLCMVSLNRVAKWQIYVEAAA